PHIIQGWHHTPYAHKDTERYSYIGKDNAQNEPEWVDWGGKAANAAADAAKK
ncbi:unnamed protein product, partial [Ectocarpus sp. 13 AM-2016]